MLLSLKKTTHFKLKRPKQPAKMSRQHKMALSMMQQSQSQFRPPVRPSMSRALPGYVINLDCQDLQYQTCIHVSDFKDDLVVHIRKFRNSIPTQTGIRYSSDGWKALTELMPTLDRMIRGESSGIVRKALFALDSEKSVMILNGGARNVQVIFQREDKHIVLSYDQWVTLWDKQEYIRNKIVDHIHMVIARLEARE